MMTATEFYKINLEHQRKILKARIEAASTTGDPCIVLPFDTYPIVEQEMDDLGWDYDYYEDEETGKRYAIFSPKQYQYDD